MNLASNLEIRCTSPNQPQMAYPSRALRRIGMAVLLPAVFLAAFLMFAGGVRGLMAADVGLLYVAPSGSDSNACSLTAPCLTIQEAITKANAGDEIRVAAGLYTAPGASAVVNVDKSLTLRGGFTTSDWQTPDPAVNVTIIDGETARRGVYISIFGGGAPVTVSGFHIRNGWTQAAFSDNFGGGVYNKNAALTLLDDVFYGNAADQHTFMGTGGAVASGSDAADDPASLSMHNVVLHDNRAQYGSAIFVASGTAVVDRTRVYSNVAVGAAAIYIDGDSVIQNSLVHDNRLTAASADGAGIYVQGTSAVIQNVTLYGNDANDQGGGLYVYTGTVVVSNTLFVDNSAATGGDFYLRNGSLSIAASDFDGNTPGHDQAGLDALGADNQLRDPAFVDAAGGDFRLSAGSPSIDSGLPLTSLTEDVDGYGRPFGTGWDRGAYEYTPASDCYARVNAGQVYTDVQPAVDAASAEDTVKVAGLCRGVYTRGGESQVVYIDKALTLRGAYTVTDWVATRYGPTVLDANRQGHVLSLVASGEGITVENLYLTGGLANYGAGIYAPNGSMMLTLRNAVVHGNVAAIQGGGLYNGSTADVDSTVFYSNTASTTGGAIYTRHDMSVRNSVLLDNVAGAGGGFYASLIAEAEITGDYNVFFGNASDDYGNAASGEHDMTVDPQLIDPANGDFHLLLSSPLINAADPATAPATDIEGDLRPQGTRADIGVDERTIFAAVEIDPHADSVVAEDLATLQGKVFTFTHTIENTGYTPSLADTYDIAVTNGAGWPFTVTGQTDGVVLAFGETHAIQVAVGVPAAEPKGFYNQTLITATSRTSVNALDVARDVIANPGIVFTPSYTETADPGEVLTYTHVLTNVGPADVFGLTFDTLLGWGELISPESSVALGANEPVTVVVRVAVAKTAPAGLEDITTITATSQTYGIAESVVNRTTAKATTGTRYVIPGGLNTRNNCTQPDAPCGDPGYAVQQAASGDAVLMVAGTYTIVGSEMLIDKNVSLEAGYRYSDGEFVAVAGTPDPAETILDFGSASRGIRIKAGGAGSLLTGFTIRNAATDGYGGGVLLEGAANVVLVALNIDTVQANRGGAVYIAGGSATLSQLTITGAQAQIGGAIYNASGNVTADSVIVHGAQATTGAGGGIYNAADASLTLVNSVVYSSTASSGAGIYNAGLLTAWNNTLVGNHAETAGGGLHDDDSVGLTVRNTIFVSNTAVTGGGAYRSGVLPADADYNLFWDNQADTYAPRNLPAAAHDIEADPLFLDVAGADFHLTFESPCVDSGDAATSLTTDFEQEPRPANQGYDIGADELGGCLARIINTGTGEQIGDIFNGVQQAVDAAPAGALIQLSGICFGVHQNDLHGQTVNQTAYITKSLTLIGGYSATFEKKPGQTATLDALGKGRVVVVTNPTTETLQVTLKDLTIQHGETGVGEYGAGLYLDAAIDLRLENVVLQQNNAGAGGGGLYNHSGGMLSLAETSFISNTASSGGGMYNSGAATVVSPTLFLSNEAIANGGGLYNASGAHFQFSATTVLSNTAVQGGGIYNVSTAALTVTNSFIVSNTVTQDGGGLYNLSPQFLVRHATLFSNAAKNGAAIYHDAPEGALINSSLLISNTASLAGGGLYVAAGAVAPSFDYNGLYGNQGGNTFPGVLPAIGSVAADPQFVSIDPDAATFLHIAGGSPAEDAGDPQSPILEDAEGTPRPSNQGFDIGADEVGDCYVRINGEAPTYGNVQWAIDHSQDGDAIHIAGTCRGVNAATVGAETLYQTAFVTRSLVFRGGYTVTNWLVPDPAVYTTTLDATGGGRVMFIQGTPDVTITGLHLINGQADTGAGLFVGGGVVTATQNTFQGHSATADGGALYNQGGRLILDGNRLSDNTAVRGAALYHGGGESVVQNNFIYRNTAQDGGVYNATTSTLLVHHNTFYGNTANRGAGLFTENHAPSVRSNIFSENTGNGHAIYSSATTGSFSTPDYNSLYPSSNALFGTAEGAHDQVIDPGLRDPAADDFRLVDDSPVLDKGDPTMVLDYDFEGDLRPADQGFDIGADERRSCWAMIVRGTGADTARIGPFASPQLAVDVSELGDVIRVSVGECRGVHAYTGGSGTLLQTVHITQDLTMTGGYDREFLKRIDADGVEKTVFNPQLAGRALVVANTSMVTVTDITLANGNAALGGGPDMGGGFYAAGGHVLLSRVEIQNSQAESGGGLASAGNALTLSAAKVYSNTATLGGGLYVPSGVVTITNASEFRGNTATYGGALYNHGGIVVADKQASFEGNEASSDGGGLYQHSSVNATMILAGAHVAANRAVRGGGLFAESNSDVALDMGTRLYANSAQQGGAVYGAGNDLTIWNSLIYANTAQQGAGVYLGNAGSPQVRFNTVVSNTATQDGGGVYVAAGGTPYVQNNIFDANAATTGSAVYAAAGMLNYNNYVPGDAAAQVAGGVSAGTVNLNSNPLYVESVSLSGYTLEELKSVDFHLAAYSPMIDQGLDVAINHDMDDGPRPVNQAPDIGADEYPECLAKVASTGALFGSIQAAVDNAGENDIVDVAQGVCRESLELSKNVTIRGSWKTDFSGQDSAVSTFVTAEDLENERVVLVSPNTTVDMSRVDLVGGSAIGDGGGMYVSDGAVVSLGRAGVTGCSATQNGGGIYVAAGGSLVGTELGISWNEALGDGGGIYNASAGTLHLSGATFSLNSAEGSGGGAYSAAGAQFSELYNASFRYNSAGTVSSSGYGGGLYNASPDLILTNVGFGYNWASGSGGAVYNAGTGVSFKHNTVAYNEADGQGDGLYNTGSGVTFNAGIVSKNGPDGEGIRSVGDDVVVTHSLRWQNSYINVADGVGNLTDRDPLLDELYPSTLSPAIDRVAESDSNVFEDHVGNPRPQICGKDMGYHEFSVGERFLLWDVPDGVTRNSGTVYTYTLQVENQSEEWHVLGDETTSMGVGSGYTETVRLHWQSSQGWAVVGGVNNAANVVIDTASGYVTFDIGAGDVAEVLLRVSIPQGQLASVTDDPDTWETTNLNWETLGCLSSISGQLNPIETLVTTDASCEFSLEQAAAVIPGGSVMYTHVITNVGNITDTYDLVPALGFYAAAEVISPTALITQSLSTVRLGPGMSETLQLRVTMRPEIAAGLDDIATLIGRSQTTGLPACTVADTTSALATTGIRYVATGGLDSLVDETQVGNPVDLADNNCTQPQVSPCRTLQQALSQARSGEEVRVAAGTYAELYTVTPATDVLTQLMYIDKPLSISGGYLVSDWNAEPPDHITHTTVLDAQGNGRGIVVATSGRVQLDRLTVTGGNAGGQGGAPGGDAGGNVYNAGADLALNALTLSDGVASVGGGLYSAGGVVTLTNNVIRDNGTGFTGSSVAGGGIYLDGGAATVVNNTFYQNYAGEDGSAVYLAQGDLTLTNNLIAGNASPTEAGSGDHAALYTATGTTSVVDYNLWSQNTVADVSGTTTGTHAVLSDDPALTADLELTEASPAREAGDPATPMTLFPFEQDQWNQPRRMGLVIDIGAYEYPVEPSMDLTPAYRYEVHDPGAVLVYTHLLTNTGEFTDTFTILHDSSRGWITTWPTSPVEVGPGESVLLTLSGQVPSTGSRGLLDVSAITVTSGLSAGAYVVASDETRANFTPGVELVPASQTGMIAPAKPIIYSITITNTGDGWDSFGIGLDVEPGWVANASAVTTPELAPGTSTMITLTVMPPAGAISDTLGVVTVTATSAFSSTVSDTATATTAVLQVRGVQLTSDQSQTIGAVDAVTYTHTLTNTGNYTDSIDLAYVSSEGWAGVFVEPESPVVLGPGASTAVIVRLSVPADGGRTEDVTSITASLVESSIQGEVTDTTTVTGVPDFELTPTTAMDSAMPGDVIVFTHRITNTGNVADTYDLALSGAQPTWSQVAPSYVSLTPGMSASILVTITVPTDAGNGDVVTTLSATSRDSVSTLSAEDTVTVVVDPDPITGLAAINDSPTVVNSTTMFTATVTGGTLPINYAWNFGDGTTGTGASTTHMYTAVGTFTATVTATNVAGSVFTTTIVTVDALPPDPITGLVATNDSPTVVNTATAFTATVTGGTLPISYAWNFGDGATGTGASTTHTYATVGTFTAIVTATNAAGSVFTTTIVTVTETPPDPITGLVATNDSPTVVNTSTAFTATVTGGTAPISYAWNFGDGATGTSASTTHTYATAGTFTATVTATNAAGSTAATTVVTVIEAVTNAAFAPDRDGTADPGTVAVYTHTLTNTGNVALTVDLQVTQNPSWVVSLLPASSFQVAPGASRLVTVSVTVPANAVSGLVHSVVISATAQEDAALARAVRDSTTVNRVYGVSLSPERVGQGLPGASVVYHHTLTNLGNTEDTFTLQALSSSAWSVSVTPDSVTLEAFATQPVTVVVTIPDGAVIGAQDTAVIQAASQGDIAQTSEISDTTTVIAVTRYAVYLPLVIRPAADGPNLVVTGITVTPVSPEAGASVTVRVTVQNRGSQPVTDGNNFYVDFYVNDEPGMYLSGDLSWGAQGSWFGVGETYTFENVYVFPSGGVYQLYAQVDTDNSVVEGSESDNRYGPQAITVSGPGRLQDGASPATPALPGGPRPTPTPLIEP